MSLGIRAGVRVWLGGHNLRAKREIDKYLGGTQRTRCGDVDLAFIVPDSADEGRYFHNKIRPRIRRQGMVWWVASEETWASWNVVSGGDGDDSEGCAEGVPLGTGFLAVRRDPASFT